MPSTGFPPEAWQAVPPHCSHRHPFHPSDHLPRHSDRSWYSLPQVTRRLLVAFATEPQLPRQPQLLPLQRCEPLHGSIAPLLCLRLLLLLLHELLAPAA